MPSGYRHYSEPPSALRRDGSGYADVRRHRRSGEIPFSETALL